MGFVGIPSQFVCKGKLPTPVLAICKWKGEEFLFRASVFWHLRNKVIHIFRGVNLLLVSTVFVIIFLSLLRIVKTVILTIQMKGPIRRCLFINCKSPSRLKIWSWVHGNTRFLFIQVMDSFESEKCSSWSCRKLSFMFHSLSASKKNYINDKG